MSEQDMDQRSSGDDGVQCITQEIDTEHGPTTPMTARRRTPIPKVQLFLLLLMQFCEPINATVIFPFVFRLVNETGVTKGNEDRTGYYAGIIESTFFLVETLFVLQWGRLSDKIGRRPVVLIGLLGLTLSMLCFGLSRSFPALVASRSLVGLLNGNVGVLKSMLGEITDDTNAAQGFAFLPIVWSTGSTIGPLIGGLFARPADHWEMFDLPFWREFPYFLPCASAAGISLTAFVVGFIWLKETVPAVVTRQQAKEYKQRRESRLLRPESTPLLGDHPSRSCSPSAIPAVEAPPLKALFTAPVITAVLNYSLLALTEISFTALLPIYLASTPLSLTPRAIGIFIGSMGIFNGIFQAVYTAALVERWGAKRVYQVSVCAFFPLWAVFPGAINIVTTVETDFSYPWSLWFFACIGVVFATVMDMSFSTIFLFIRSAAPTPAAMGATNGLSQTMASLMRTVGPACVTSLYAVSREHQLLHGDLIYVVLILISAVTFSASFLLPRM